MSFSSYRKFIFALLFLLMAFNSSHAQMDQLFKRMFNDILREQMFSFGPFGRGFDAAALEADTTLSEALNSLIASNVSSFPLTSTIAGVSFDLSSGTPELITESLGPIYAENAETIGKNKLNLAFNYSYYNLAKFRGLNTDDFRFTFTYADIDRSGILGDNLIENDTIDIFPDLDISASTMVFYATYGLTGNFDISMAIPFIHLNIQGKATAILNSISFFQTGVAVNSFNGDPQNPEFRTTFNYNESVTGIGDIAVRLKYVFSQKSNLDLAAFVDLRLPTGDENDFLGTGKVNSKFTWIISRKFGDFSSHFNLSYDRRPLDVDSDEIEYILGFDQKISNAATFILSLLGDFDLEKNESIQLLPGSKTIISSTVREIDRSNIDERNRDNTVTLSTGVRLAPSHHVSFLANILVPLNDGGLRSSVAPTFGLAVSF